MSLWSRILKVSVGDGVPVLRCSKLVFANVLSRNLSYQSGDMYDSVGIFLSCSTVSTCCIGIPLDPQVNYTQAGLRTFYVGWSLNHFTVHFGLGKVELY
jgi:hypothetical protein